MVKKTRKKSFRKKQKGGACDRYDKQGKGVCSNNAKACCDAKPRDQRLCHFNDALKEDVKRNGRNNSRIFADMQREHNEYHDEENKHADLIFNVTGFRNGDPIYDKTKYKDEVGQKGEDILSKITKMRREWLDKYYRKDCYDCDGNCREHNKRARSADLTARASKAKQVLNTRDAYRKAAAAQQPAIQRMDFKEALIQEINAGDFRKAKNMLDDWSEGLGKDIGTGSGMTEKKFAELEKKVLENLKVSAEGGASSKKRGRKKSRRIRKSRKKLRSRKSRKNKKSRKLRKSRRRR